MSEQRIEIIALAEPRWSERCESGELECRNVYTGMPTILRDVAFLTYSTPRCPDDALAQPLREAGIDVHMIGDCRAPRAILAATAEGNTAGNAL